MGANLFFPCAGAVLEAAETAIDQAVVIAWRVRVQRARAHLGWPPAPSIARTHSAGTSLAIAAPCDQLFLATEINEWAFCAGLVECDPIRWDGLERALVGEDEDANEAGAPESDEPAPVIEERAAFERFDLLAAREANPALLELTQTAAARELQYVVDESELTLGAGSGSRSFALTSLPAVDEVAWPELRNIPTVLVTGSNGKTTTVRLLAASARAHGWPAGYCCTDGVFLDDDLLVSGDYSGPDGARRVMREQRAQAAVIETARGGILRRGIAVTRADVALITNVSADHFGEYGIDDLKGLAEVKLCVAAVLAPRGLIVMNADDAHLRTLAGDATRRFGRCPALGWFALDADQEFLRHRRRQGESICAVRDGRLMLWHQGVEADLGAVTAMPLSVGGIADYNVANLAAAALGAIAIGIPAATIAAVFSGFGANLEDNPGRMMRFEAAGVHVLVDYAHNPDGLRGLLNVAAHLRGEHGRLGVLIGHAGNRRDEDIRALARAAAEFRPDLIVIKENEAHMRGRMPGEVPRIFREEFLRLGFAESALPVCDSEAAAARCAIAWARPGDVLALPVHSIAARETVIQMLGRAMSGT